MASVCVLAAECRNVEVARSKELITSSARIV